MSPCSCCAAWWLLYIYVMFALLSFSTDNFYWPVTADFSLQLVCINCWHASGTYLQLPAWPRLTLSCHERTLINNITILSRFWLPTSLQISAEFNFADLATAVNKIMQWLSMPCVAPGFCWELECGHEWSRNTPSSHFLLRKPEIGTDLMGH